MKTKMEEWLNKSRKEILNIEEGKEEWKNVKRKDKRTDLVFEVIAESGNSLEK